MKLIKADLRRYRSIEEMAPFAIQPDVTCLVGKNESGKTAVLQALYKSHPVDSATFDEGLDYPSRLTRERKGEGKIQATKLTYELDDDDVAAMESKFGVGVLRSREVTVSTGYRFSATTWGVHTDEAKAVEHLREGLDLPSTAQKNADKALTVSQLLEVLAGLEAPTASATAVIAEIEKWRKHDIELALIDALSRRRPKFVYFGDYDSMPGKVSIPHLIARKDAKTLTRGEEAVLALLDMAGVSLDDFLQPESHEHLIRDLENASNSISDEVFEYWTQNKNLSVRLDIRLFTNEGVARV